MTDHPDIVVLTTAKSSFEAKVIASLLIAENIPTYTDQGMFNEQFAMDLEDVEIKVPEDRLEEAKKTLADADAAKELLEREDFDTRPDDGAAPT